MIDQLRIYPDVRGELSDPFVASCALGTVVGDDDGLYMPTLRLEPVLLRGICTGGKTLFGALNHCRVHRTEGTREFTLGRYSYVWGDLKLFETGEPVAVDVLLLRGRVTTPDLRIVMETLQYLRDAAKRGLMHRYK